MSSFLMGCGAGFSGDRVDAAAPVVKTLIKRKKPSALMFEMLAERTLATAQLQRRANPERGYEPLLELELTPILKDCLEHKITIVSNFGAANPMGAAKAIQRLAAQLGLKKPKIAVVTGDDLSSADGLDVIKKTMAGQGEPFDSDKFVCANVYQGAFEIAEAIKAGAEIVVTGRVADPSLALGPAIAHFGWGKDDLNALAGATMAGHLLECGAQVTGGYFADPGRKDVPGMDCVGFPIAEIRSDGSCIITKADDTGGAVNTRTVKEQLLYEVHDPAAYITPDVIADLSHATVNQVGPDAVSLEGVIGHHRTDTLKANIFFDGGWFGEGEISYAGPNAQGRAQLAIDILRKRNASRMPLRFDLIGLVSMMGDDNGNMLASTPIGDPPELRVRVASKHSLESEIDWLLRDITALWTGGPAGGGGVRTAKRQRLRLVSCLIPRSSAPASWEFV